ERRKRAGGWHLNFSLEGLRDGDSRAARFQRLTSYHGLRFFGRFRHHLVGLRDPNDFFDSCFALSDAAPAVLSQSLHAFGNRTLLELATIALLHDQFS